MSLSSRRAWIEISLLIGRPITHMVALLTESVDRNSLQRTEAQAARVALLTESVDRNPTRSATLRFLSMSLSSRRAWIEIAYWCIASDRQEVALLTESVDRNYRGRFSWRFAAVALLTESVDRNVLGILFR